jgi:uncharacterized protein
MSDTHVILWRRIDIIGHDACRISPTDGGWTIEGTALFLEAGKPSKLNYSVVCDKQWRSCSARAWGWIGGASIDMALERNEERTWRASGAPLRDLDGVLDLDLGFTPATNTNAIKRMKLEIGQQLDTVAAWLDPSDWTVKPLAQSYKRLDIRTYDYHSPLHGYRATLRTDDFGFVVDYPNLWVRE